MHFPLQKLTQPRKDTRVRKVEKRRSLVTSREHRLFRLATLALYFRDKDNGNQAILDTLGLLIMRLYWEDEINRAITKYPDFLYTWSSDSPRIASWLKHIVAKHQWITTLNQARRFAFLLAFRRETNAKRLGLGELVFIFTETSEGDIILTGKILDKPYVIKKTVDLNLPESDSELV